VLREATGLTIQVEVKPVGSIPRSEGKAARVIDRRPK
jgi:phenylacetate-coenzyme A ligase PaaK-like adenylate-forming protein